MTTHPDHDATPPPATHDPGQHTPPPDTIMPIVWRWVVVASVLVPLCLGLALGWWLWAPSATDDTDATQETHDAQDGAKPPTYTCPMHPQIRSQDPKEPCPICGMALVAATDDDDDDGDELPRLRLTARAAALLQVEVQPVQQRAVHVPVQMYGRIAYDETQLRTLTAWAPGRIEKLHHAYTGSVVEPGQPMVELYSPALIAAQEELLQALRAYQTLDNRADTALRDMTRQTLEASRDRLRLQGLDHQQIQGIEAGGKVVDVITLPAPTGGIVLERLATTGDYVQTGQPIYRIADLAVLWLQLEVYESQLALLKVGQQADFTVQSLPGRRFEGTIVFVDPVLSDRTRTARVRIEVDNPDGTLKPGMLARGTIQADYHAPPRDVSQDHHDPHTHNQAHDDCPHCEHDDAHAHTDDSDDSDAHLPLLIPASAALITGQRAVVYVQVPDAEQPTYDLRDIVLGPRAGAWYVVLEGLSKGELVVTHGAFKIDSELQRRGRRSMMHPERGKPAPSTRPATDDELAAYPLETCIVTDLALDSMGGAVAYEHEGRAVLFCCDTCLPRFRADPQPYLDKLDAAGEGGDR